MKVWLLIVIATFALALSVRAAEIPATNAVRIVELQGAVQVLPAGTQNWAAATNNEPLQAHDRIRTAANSRVALRWSDQSVVPFGASTELEVLPPAATDNQSGLHLIRGVVSFFHRDKPGRIHIITRGAVAGVEGTEFLLAVDHADRTTLSVVDGKVRIGNDHGTLLLTNGQQAVVDLGQAPVRTAGFIANNLLQWCFYYPAVLDPDDLQLTVGEQTELAASLAAYRSGDLQLALKQYPVRNSDSDVERIYHAALLLSVGDVERTEAILKFLTNPTGRNQQLADSLRQLIAAVKLQPSALTNQLNLATEWMADSYFQQSRAVREVSLRKALAAAKQAAAQAPQFGFAWERVAELEFSFGRTKEALKALDKSLALAPRNAQALALKGFILNVENEPSIAWYYFNEAIAADSALGNAWLGRGIVRMRLRDTAGGREDLLIAAALEPQRSELRSYLGKAYIASGDYTHATKELDNAKRLDPNDPTPWLYSALEKQQNNQINSAIRDLEKSQALNDNRSVYRSQLLLDQDQAVRSANLASIYQDAGMTDVSIREADKAVNYDYANYSAHNFLANSYIEQYDSYQNHIRVEPVVASEYLLANLLAPASAGVFSASMGQQQHFIPFAQNHLGAISSTEYLSRGAWTETAMQYGTFDNFSYGVSGNYYSDPGQYPDNDLLSKSLSLTVKLGLTPQDDIYGEVNEVRRNGGNTSQYYDPYAFQSNYRFNERQDPDVILGYHHEWQPGVHSLVFASRFQDDYSFNSSVPVIEVTRFPYYTTDPNEIFTVLGGLSMHANYHNTLTLYSTEAQQVIEQNVHTTIFGGRYQYGTFNTQNLETHPSALVAGFDSPPANQSFDTTLKRFSVYGYHYWQIFEPLQLIGGFSYDWINYPENLLSLPISSQNDTAGQLSPKAGFIWTPLSGSTVRFAYTKSLGSEDLDQSQRIEPAQVAGFQQTFRTIIGEPSVSQNGLARNETFGLSLEQKFSTGTYLGLTGEILKSKFNQTVGVFDNVPLEFPYDITSGLEQDVNYHEESLQLTINQLLGRDWALGGIYRLSYAKLTANYPEVSKDYDQLYHNPAYPFNPYQANEATLNQVYLYAIYNLPCGFFSQADTRWYSQNNTGYSGSEPGDNFWQFDAFVGWRFWHRMAEVSVGLLNITDQNYRLNPLNAYSDLPRERTFVARFKFNF